MEIADDKTELKGIKSAQALFQLVRKPSISKTFVGIKGFVGKIGLLQQLGEKLTALQSSLFMSSTP